MYLKSRKKSWSVILLVILPCSLVGEERSCKGIATVMDVIAAFQPYSHFDIGVVDSARRLESCDLMGRMENTFQTAVLTNHSSQLAPFLNRNTLVLEVSNQLDQLQPTLDQLQQLRAAWRRDGYASYFLVVPHYDVNNTNLTTTVETWASKVSLDSDAFIWILDPDGDLVHVFEFYAIKGVTVVRDLLNDFSRSEMVNSSTGSDPTNLSKLLHKIARRSNFFKAPIIATNVDNSDYELATKFRHFPNSTYLEFESGYEVLILWYLRDALNFTDKALAWDLWIRPGPNGSIIGLAIPVNKGYADIAITAAEFLLWRVSGPDGLTYLHPMFYNKLIGVFKQPPASSIRNIFLITFSPSLWIILFAVWVLTCLSLSLTIKVAQIQNPFLLYSHDDDLKKDSWLWAISTVCQQGWHTTPLYGPTRTVFISGFFTSIVTYIAYSAALVAVLSVQVIPVHFFADLLQYKFNIFSDNHIPTAKFAVETLMDRGLIKTLPNDGRNIEVASKIKDLTRLRTAIVTQSDSFYPILAKRGITEAFACSSLSSVAFSTRPVLSAHVVKRGSPLRTFFNNKVIQMRERGVMQVTRERYLDLTTFRCGNDEQNSREPIGLLDVLTAYIIWCLGVSISVAGFLVEKAFFKRKENSIHEKFGTAIFHNFA